jgi:[glutamine synthetase] adenylyltransferase / [glutamine synthetase]-adenylyl-L-tyrosine phosphorylase
VAVLTGRIQGEGRATGTADVLSRLEPDFARPNVVQELVAAHALYSELTQVIRLCLTGGFERSDVPPGLADLLLRNTDLPDLGVLEAHMAETARRVEAHFDSLLRGKHR